MAGLIFTDQQRETFIESYITAALDDISDSCTVTLEECPEDCNGSHGRGYVTRGDLSTGTLDRLTRDAGNFFGVHAPDLARYPGDHNRTPDEWPDMGGYYFWMQRSGHGTGFGDWYEPGRHPQDPDMIAARDRLQEACRTLSQRELYRGDDSKIHHGLTRDELAADLLKRKIRGN